MTRGNRRLPGRLGCPFRASIAPLPSGIGGYLN